MSNYFFYARWDMNYLLLIPAASTIDYFLGRGLMASREQGFRRVLLGISVLLNVGLLAQY